MNTNKEPLVLQAGKTYVTKGGEVITVKSHSDFDPWYQFSGDNGYVYSSFGTLYEDEHDYTVNDNADRAHDISHELTEQTEDWHDSPCDECCNVCDECDDLEDYTDEPQVHLLDKFKFKQNTNGTKRKLIVKDYSDSTVEFIFKQKDDGSYETTGGFRLSYEAVVLLYNSLEFLLEGQERDPLELH
jgi:hypothetical protein